MNSEDFHSYQAFKRKTFSNVVKGLRKTMSLTIEVSDIK